MPISVKKTSGFRSYVSPFVGPVNHTTHVKLDVSDLTTGEVDAKGYLKPGVPLKIDGTKLDGTSGEYTYGVVMEPIKIVDENPTNDTLGADTSDPLIVVANIAVINRDIAEDNLGRAYTSNELAGFNAAGSKLVLTTT